MNIDTILLIMILASFIVGVILSAIMAVIYYDILYLNGKNTGLSADFMLPYDFEGKDPIKAAKRKFYETIAYIPLLTVFMCITFYALWK